MTREADAYEQYGQAAIIDLLATMLPEVVREASAPMSAIEKSNNCWWEAHYVRLGL